MYHMPCCARFAESFGIQFTNSEFDRFLRLRLYVISHTSSDGSRMCLIEDLKVIQMKHVVADGEGLLVV